MVGWSVGGRHETVSHGIKEHARADVTTSPLEGFFSFLKRGMDGTFDSVSSQHLHRYAAAFEFRYTHRNAGDGHRTIAAIVALRETTHLRRVKIPAS